MNCEVPGFLLPRAIKDCCTFRQATAPCANDSWQSRAYSQCGFDLSRVSQVTQMAFDQSHPGRRRISV